MMKKHNLTIEKLATSFVVLITILSMAVVSPAQACSRLVYHSSPNGPITARSMDWFADPNAKLWVFPKGMKRNGGAGANSIEWTSKYGSIITSSYNISTVDGINEKGLVANLLFLEATDYGNIEPGEKTLSLGGWGQYVLDNYATVKEAVQGLNAKPFQLVTATFNDLVKSGHMSMPPELQALVGEKEFSLHLSISDPSGDSAIFEYLNGELKVHHDDKYDVLTNDPIFDEQLALKSYWKNRNSYWEDVIKNGIDKIKGELPPETQQKLNQFTGGLNQFTGGVFLPGTSDPSDRFIRASYYLQKMNANLIAEKNNNRRDEIAAAFGIIRNVSDPFGLASFNPTTTQWRAVASQNKNPDQFAYFFEYTKSPNVVWVMMTNLNLEEGAPVRALDKITSLDLVGEVSKQFHEATPFSWDLSFVLDE